MLYQDLHLLLLAGTSTVRVPVLPSCFSHLTDIIKYLRIILVNIFSYLYTLLTTILVYHSLFIFQLISFITEVRFSYRSAGSIVEVPCRVIVPPENMLFYVIRISRCNFFCIIISPIKWKGCNGKFLNQSFRHFQAGMGLSITIVQSLQ